VSHPSGTSIFELIERTTPDLTTFTEKKDSVSQVLLFSKQQTLYGNWFTKLVEESDIVNNVEAVRNQTGN
jgi:hypothetical protein